MLPFPTKGDPRIFSNYPGTMLTSMAANIYNTLLLNRLRTHLDSAKKPKWISQNKSTNEQILTILDALSKEQKSPINFAFQDFSI